MPSRRLAATPPCLPPRALQFKGSFRPSAGGGLPRDPAGRRKDNRTPGQKVVPRSPKGQGAARSDCPARRRHPGRDLLSFRPFVLLSSGPGFGGSRPRLAAGRRHRRRRRHRQPAHGRPKVRRARSEAESQRPSGPAARTAPRRPDGLASNYPRTIARNVSSSMMRMPRAASERAMSSSRFLILLMRTPGAGLIL